MYYSLINLFVKGKRKKKFDTITCIIGDAFYSCLPDFVLASLFKGPVVALYKLHHQLVAWHGSQSDFNILCILM